jgi:hypothetical protein
MASWQVIEYTGRTIKQLIERRVALLLPFAGINVYLATVANFDQFANTKTPIITLFLYSIVDNPQMRNAAERRFPDGTRARQPLPLELCYMITAWGVRNADTPDADQQAAEEEHRMLGLVMEALYDGAELGRADLIDDGALGPVWMPIDSMQIVLDSLPIEDQYRIWDSGESPYRLSITYRARVMALDPLDRFTDGRVTQSNFVAGQAEST